LQASNTPNARDAIPILPLNKSSTKKKFNYKDKVKIHSLHCFHFIPFILFNNYITFDFIPFMHFDDNNNLKFQDIPILGAFRGQTLELSVPEGETSAR
jgi:hypothetical protein